MTDLANDYATARRLLSIMQSRPGGWPRMESFYREKIAKIEQSPDFMGYDYETGPIIASDAVMS